MRRFVTFSEKQMEHIKPVMDQLGMDSLSQFLYYTVLAYESSTSAKRPVGRPPKVEKEIDDLDPENPDNDVLRYQAPDYPKVTSPYSYNLIRAYYDFDARRGPVPNKADLPLHEPS